MSPIIRELTGATSHVRHGHSINLRSERVAWYTASGPPLRVVPIPPADAGLADIYINIFDETRGAFQMCLRVDPPAWEMVSQGHPHPSLEGYVLNVLDDYEPR